MDGLGIVEDSGRIFIMPIKGSNKYYCLWWGFKIGKEFVLSRKYYWSSHNKLLGPQELTTWLD